MALRLLQLLFCLLLAVPTNLAARPENRVGGSPAFPSVFVPGPSLQTTQPQRENPSVGQGSASGVCKYLYVHGNPVNGTDPSGHEFTIAGTMSAVGNGFWIATRVGSTAYAAYSKVEWLRDGVELLSATVATGTIDPVALGFWASDFRLFSRICG
jgi:hypothetical protein